MNSTISLGDLFELYSNKKIIFQSLLSLPYRKAYRPDNFVTDIELMFRPAQLAKKGYIFVAENEKKQYEVLDENIELSTFFHYIENSIALPKCEKGKEIFAELSGKYFKDLPCLVQKSILQTKVDLFLFFAKDHKELYQDIQKIGF